MQPKILYLFAQDVGSCQRKEELIANRNLLLSNAQVDGTCKHPVLAFTE